MIAKEDLSFARKTEFSSKNANSDEKDDDDSDSLSSNSSSERNNENINYSNARDLGEKRLERSFQKVIIDTKQKSRNRQRRKSFLTGKNDSSFIASPFLGKRAESNVKDKIVTNFPCNDTSITAKDILEQDNCPRKQLNLARENNSPNITRLLSKGSDMSLTLRASQEELDSCPMFTQVFTQITDYPNQIETANEVEMEDADNMFSEALTQAHSNHLKKADNCSDDESDGMFSQKDTQLSSNENENAIRQTDNSSSLHTININNSKYQQPSFQNFSSGSAKAALESLATGLEHNTSSKKHSTESTISQTKQKDNEREKANISSENSSETGDNSPLEINEEEELAVSIMTQAFSEALSDGKGEKSPGALSDYQNIEECTNEHLPATQPSFHIVLEGVVAYVEVRTANENRSACVKSRLLSIGVKVSEFLNTSCTHLVFKDGSLSTYNKAKKLGLHIVSVSWIEACRNDCSRLPEANFPCSNRERYEAPGLFPKLRKAKSMQPKPEEDFIRALNSKINRKEKAKQRTEEKIKAAQKAEKDRLYNPFTYRVRHPFPDHYYNSPTNATNLSNKNVIGKKPSVLEMLKEYDSCITADNVMSPTFIEFTSPNKRCSIDCNKSENEGKSHVPETPSPCRSDDLNTPLFKRIAERINRRNSYSNSAKVPKHNSSRKKKTLPIMDSSLDESVLSNRDTCKETIITRNRDTDTINGQHDSSPNPSPIAGKSFFYMNNTNKEGIKSPRTVNSNENKHDTPNETRNGIVSSSINPRSIVRTRSSTRKSVLNTRTLTAIISDSPNEKLNDIKIPANTSVASPFSGAKSIVRTRSNNLPKNLPATVHAKKDEKKYKSPKTNNVGQKKRRILFSENSRLLAESPTGMTQEIEWKIPSPPKNARRSRKSVSAQTTTKSTTKIVRSESGSLLYAEPPKSNIDPSKRHTRRSHANSRKDKRNRINSEDNPDGSYGQDDIEYFSSGNVNVVQRNMDIKRTILPSRRSTAEFQSPLGPVTRKRSSKINLVPVAEEIAFTSCSREDIDLARQLSKTFSSIEGSNSQLSSQSSYSSGHRGKSCLNKPRTIRIASNCKVTELTTHVVCGDSTDKNGSSQCSSSSQNIQQPRVRRTINLLKGILHGCWILSVNWLYDSLELGHWADEEVYELNDFSPAVKNMRLEKEAFFSPSYGIKFCSVSDSI